MLRSAEDYTEEELRDLRGWRGAATAEAPSEAAALVQATVKTW